MTVSRFGFVKSETRELADFDRLGAGAPGSRLSQPTDWHQSNSAFLIALVAIGVVLTVLALVLRA